MHAINKAAKITPVFFCQNLYKFEVFQTKECSAKKAYSRTTIYKKNISKVASDCSGAGNYQSDKKFACKFRLSFS